MVLGMGEVELNDLGMSNLPKGSGLSLLALPMFIVRRRSPTSWRRWPAAAVLWVHLRAD